MKTQKISTKIKTLGALLFIVIMMVIATTLYLNEQNKQDALVINVAGKQRMLTQKIAKNVFYIYKHPAQNFVELNHAIKEFAYSLESLKKGNELIGISKAPTQEISTQFYIIDVIWESYHQSVEEFKQLISSTLNPNTVKQLEKTIETIHQTNTVLLNEVDLLVHYYTLHAQNKTKFLENFQYVALLVLLVLFVYIFVKFKEIEKNAREFIESTKKLVSSNDIQALKPLDIQAESEIVEVSDTINCFINKINSAVNYSASAIEQSKQASNKLEEITDEFDKILKDLKDSDAISKQIYQSEDIVIESTEELINSTKRLQVLKEQLDKLKNQCQEKD
jgi:nitrate/nitrite-specific signal transduction histidine kinase